TSVHAFASDPDRGVFILGFLLVVVGGSLLLYALRAPVVKSQIGFAWSSREALLLVNNVVLVVAALMVLLGTLYPLIMSAFDTLVSVGPPYFNGMFLPLMAILMAALGVGILSRWKQTPVSWLVGQLKWVLLLSAAGAVVIAVWLGAHQLAIGSLLLLVFWVCGASLRDVLHKTRNKGLVSGVRALPRSYWGMTLAHIGIAVCAVGVVGASLFDNQRDLRMSPGDALELGGYTFIFDGVRHREGPNWISDQGSVSVYAGDRQITTLHPEKRLYRVKNQVMTEAGIDAGFTRDLFVAMGEPLEGDAWAMRVHIKPFVRWIWLGGLMMMAGGLLAASDKRYRLKVRQRADKTAQPLTGETA
ncbi:MAG TPA: heme lyase NrfEFG subunit NrfE, partial [Pseudomonas pachastrellae]|nr:heme lyase NrfEFG subunit NrfE [Halopseudomonas pachastrellae]